MKRTSLEERQADCRQHGHSWVGSPPRHCSWCQEHEHLTNEPTIGTPEEAQAVAMSLSDADIEQLEEEERRDVPVFGDPAWIERTRPKVAPGRCVIEVNGKRV